MYAMLNAGRPIYGRYLKHYMHLPGAEKERFFTGLGALDETEREPHFIRIQQPEFDHRETVLVTRISPRAYTLEDPKDFTLWEGTASFELRNPNITRRMHVLLLRHTHFDLWLQLIGIGPRDPVWPKHVR
jgi:hypothetical protein